MSSLHFSRWLALVGIVSGVGLAFGLPVAVMVHGKHMSVGIQLTVIILGLAAGAILATASAIVGITIPTAILDGRLDLNRLTGAGACCEPGERGEAESQQPGPGSGPA